MGSGAVVEWWCAAGDTRRQFSTLVGPDGEPLDLTGMTPTLRLAENTTGRRPRTTRGAAAIEQGGTAPNFTDQGVVSYDPAASDVAVAGELLCQWVLTTIAGDARTVPDQEPFIWRIERRL
jgi:hypothetical protein